MRLFQFTPLREGRREAQKSASQRRHFNSRPSARGDKHLCGALCAGLYFNSRPSARGDDAHGSYDGMYRDISIHAPPRGATRRYALLTYMPNYFNSRPSARGDDIITLPCRPCKFQFTPLREGRPSFSVAASPKQNFNSRPSARGDQRASTSSPPKPHFNSRPSARGDLNRVSKDEAYLISIHAPPRGATVFVNRPKIHERISIHAPPRGATVALHLFITSGRISIHAPPRGATDYPITQAAAAPYFNSRPSARGDSL